MKLIKRTDPRNLNPEDCCFIFPGRGGQPFFRIYHRKEGLFTDYAIASCITPFVKLTSDDVELKEYLRENGEIKYVMDFPECVLKNGPPPLNPGEVWQHNE